MTLNHNPLRQLAKAGLLGLRDLRRRLLPKRVFVMDSRRQPGVPDTTTRVAFFFGPTGVKVERIRPGSLKPLFFHGPILIRGEKKTAVPFFLRMLNPTFDVDETTCFVEAWHWHNALEFLQGPIDAAQGRRAFAAWRDRLPEGLSRAYVFGTGPSLALALQKDWCDGYRVVCNTIVRDTELWRHINPHAVVAGDALYHFGVTDFAAAFRRDLAERLRESPSVVFIYPAMFDRFVRRAFPEFTDRLIPIPTGQATVAHDVINEHFQLPALGNVLNLLLLPLGCSLSRRVGLWGFDGRAPNDTLFWSNSQKHSYGELLHTLRETSPAFFDEMVPKDDPEKYIRSVHGDVLTHCLSEAEKAGFTFEMLHETWTPALRKYRSAQAVAAT